MEIAAVIDVVLLFILMVALGSEIDFEKIKACFREPKGVLVGVVCQFVIMPPLGYGVGRLVGLETHFAVALVVMTCCPGGAMSNILCFVFQADVPLSVAMTATSSLVACGMMPLNLFIYIQATDLASSMDIEMLGVIISAASVVLGTGLGLLLPRCLEKREVDSACSQKVMKIVQVIGTIAAIGILTLGFISNAKSKTPLWGAPGAVYAASIIPVLIGDGLGVGIARALGLAWPSCVAVGIETSVQNKLMAIPVITLLFDDEEDQNAAYTVPMAYALFATIVNVVWCFTAWKLGLTYMDKDATCGECLDAFKKAREAQKKAKEPVSNFDSPAELQTSPQATNLSQQQTQPAHGPDVSGSQQYQAESAQPEVNVSAVTVNAGNNLTEGKES